MNTLKLLGVFVLSILAVAAASTESAEFVFRDVAKEVGLDGPLRGMMGHSAAWGDVNGDGWIDLFVGTFADRPLENYVAGGAKGPVPNRLLLNRQGERFEEAGDAALHWRGRAGGSVFADFDNDGRLDLYLANNGRLGKDNQLYHNLGGGKFRQINDSAGAPVHLPETARSATAVDYDGDGLLDLFVLSTFGRGESRLFRNLGGMKFDESSAIPGDVAGLGMAVGDVTGNGWPDILVGGPNRLFVNQGGGRFREAKELDLDWGFKHEDNAPSCGVAFGDVDRDGRLDFVIGSHSKRPWVDPLPLRLYRNLGSTPARVNFQEITQEVGLKPLPMKTAHVEIRDFDNDGWPELYSAIVIYREGRTYPAVFKNLGAKPGKLPRFEETAFRHRKDFPGPEDYDPKARTMDFYERLVANHKLMYFAPGPSGDYNRDGRLDLFLPNWFPKQGSLLLRNDTPSGHYLDVRVVGSGRVNRMGLGCRVAAYPAGKASDSPQQALAAETIAAAYGYTSGQPAVAHLGLGKAELCDVVVTLPYGLGRIVRQNVKADQELVIKTK